MIQRPKIAIIGTGVVGSTTAFSLLMHTIAEELILVDINESKCQGEGDDLSDALPFSYTRKVTKGNFRQAGQADIAIITAGVSQKPGQSRRDLLETNHTIIKSIILEMKPMNEELRIIVVSNPVDILTSVVQQYAGLPKSRIFGSGTLLDTMRLRHMLSDSIGIAVDCIDLFILGEHGDSQCVAWSSAHIAGIPLSSFSHLDSKSLDAMAALAKQKAYDIIANKGSTAFGIAACVTHYCLNIIFDRKEIVPVSCYNEEFDICLSMPAILGKNGVERIIKPFLNDHETTKLKESATLLQKYVKQVR